MDENQIIRVDKEQDWFLQSGAENDSHTTVIFSRKYRTCDSTEDLEIPENEWEQTNIIWAY